jgi:hypothetical protein
VRSPHLLRADDEMRAFTLCGINRKTLESRLLEGRALAPHFSRHREKCARTATVVPWTLSFTLDPKHYTDDPCKKEVQALAVRIRAWGEDMPIAGTGFYLHYEGSRAPAPVETAWLAPMPS